MSQPEKILVTGGAGYIGSHTAVELIRKGYEVVVADNLSNAHIESLDGIREITGTRPEFHLLDLCDREGVMKLFEQDRFDAVIHFAALKAVGESVEKPLEYYRNNLVSLLNLLEACRRYRTSHFVFSSSCSVYGEPDAVPIDEKAVRKQAKSPYGNTKKICEDILEDTVHAGELNVITLRYFNPVGAHASALIGEYPLGLASNLMPVITQTAIGKRIEPLKVFGQDYDTPDGTCIRDYIHVVDLAGAHVVSIDRLLRKKNKLAYEVFNIGTGQGVSVLGLIMAFEKVTGVKLPYTMAPRRAGDVVRVFADTRFANEELGWKAEHNLDDMIRSAWAWEQNLDRAGKIPH